MTHQQREPFGIEVGQPGDGKRPGYEPDENYTVYLPHQCDKWLIVSSPDWFEAMSELRRFQDEIWGAYHKLWEAGPPD